MRPLDRPRRRGRTRQRRPGSGSRRRPCSRRACGQRRGALRAATRSSGAARAWRPHLAARPNCGRAGAEPREREIAELVAVGASNPEIARTLFLSRKTVERHVTHILAKFGARNRVELAALLARKRCGSCRMIHTVRRPSLTHRWRCWSSSSPPTEGRSARVGDRRGACPPRRNHRLVRQRRVHRRRHPRRLAFDPNRPDAALEALGTGAARRERCSRSCKWRSRPPRKKEDLDEATVKSALALTRC